jgi:NNP family nitrate/nitrite transporter-like MFS transporter
MTDPFQRVSLREMTTDNMSCSSEGPQGLGFQIGPLLMLATVFFLGFLSRVILAPLMPEIEKDLGIGHGQAGSLFLMVSVGGLITTMSSGFVSSFLLHRWTIVVSTVCVGVALFAVALSRGISGVVIGLFLLGMAGGLYMPSGMATITALIDPRHWGKALAIHELAPNLGFVAAPLIAASMLGHFSWRLVLIIQGIVTLTFVFAFVKFGKGGNFPGKAPSYIAVKEIFRLPDYWIMIALFSLGVGASLGIYMMLPLYLIAGHGFDQERANSLIGFSRVLGVGMSFLAGWANDKLGTRKTLGMVLVSTGILTFLMGSSSGSWVLFLACLQPLIACCFFPPGFVALSSIGPPSLRNVVVSLTLPFAFILGGGAIPFLIGIMGDDGRFGSGIVIIGAMIILGGLLAVLLKCQFSQDSEQP